MKPYASSEDNRFMLGEIIVVRDCADEGSASQLYLISYSPHPTPGPYDTDSQATDSDVWI